MIDTDTKGSCIVAAPTNSLDDARAQLEDAVNLLGYDRGVYDMLATPRRELTVSIPLRRDSGAVELLVGTACSTTCLEAQPREDCATARTSTWTRFGR